MVFKKVGSFKSSLLFSARIEVIRINTIFISIIGGFFGLVLGYIIGRIIKIDKLDSKKQPIGTLHIETSDPDGPYLFLELSKDVSLSALS